MESDVVCILSVILTLRKPLQKSRILIRLSTGQWLFWCLANRGNLCYNKTE